MHDANQMFPTNIKCLNIPQTRQFMGTDSSACKLHINKIHVIHTSSLFFVTILTLGIFLVWICHKLSRVFFELNLKKHSNKKTVPFKMLANLAIKSMVFIAYAHTQMLQVKKTSFDARHALDCNIFAYFF